MINQDIGVIFGFGVIVGVAISALVSFVVDILSG